MHSKFVKAIFAVILFVGFSFMSFDAAYAARARDYSPSEFRSVLNGLGYNVTLGDTLTDEATKKAISDFQKAYKLTADGVAGGQTQDVAADLVKNLQGSLNLVVQPSPELPRNQFYGPRTEAAVKAFQKQYKLSETGIATLPVRQKLDQEAKRILGK
ncbi:peptidoglycan-binding domain-containing protein [Kamptonema formosum]|uniref:peptidoglycan-binding domain-containing protein n=1 Tax=Kamptonema formosum TaxID=331992 RepID=UPI000348A12D|nr:peptidoglycan-binding protein [Oscillatoria sp. PCC 10802]